MKRKKIKFSIPEYREKKDIYEWLGYKEISSVEKGYKTTVTFEIDDKEPHYKELMEVEKDLNRVGPPFIPIILFVIGAFILLSIYVLVFIHSIKYGEYFDFIANSISFFVPAFILLLLDVVYTYFYFRINREILKKGRPTKEEIKEIIDKIKQK